MSVVVAMQRSEEAFLSCDGRLSGSGGIYAADQQKWHFHGSWALAHLGMARQGLIVEASVAEILFDLPAGMPEAFDLLSTSNRIADVLKRNGIEAVKDDGVDQWKGCEWVLASPWGVWPICSWMAPSAAIEMEGWRVWADGSGHEIAKGVLQALVHRQVPPSTVVREAAEAAGQWVTSCGGDVRVWHLTTEGAVEL
jgi:hypothetical protein